METHNELNVIRERRGVSAAELARRVGVSRQTIYAMEAGSYVPNTIIALQLARALEVSVEDVFQLDSEPEGASHRVSAELLGSGRSIAAGQPVQLCRVGKRTIAVSVTPQPAYLPPADGVAADPTAGGKVVSLQTFLEPSGYDKRILVAGCDPGISILGQHLLEAGHVEMVAAPCSSRQALEWLKDGRVHVAGSHLRDLSSGDYNLPVVRRLFPKGGFRIVTFAAWEQGLVVQRGNPLNIRGMEDLARKDVTLINREVGAGSRDLLDQKLHDAGIPTAGVKGYDRTAPGHLPAAYAVSTGEADCCVATRAAARVLGLHFIPLAVERYDLVTLRRYASLPAVEVLLDLLNRSALRRKLEALAGYDTSQMGEVRA